MVEREHFIPKFESTKFQELVLYISDSCQDDPTFGAVKLNKILFYADFYAYRILGEPITGATYQKLPEGPAPRQMLPERRKLIASGRVKLVSQSYFSGVQQRLVPSAEYNREMASEFITDRERMIVDEVISFFKGKTAREVSDYSHRERGWILVDYGEDIPYETAWLSTDPLEEEERNFARDMAKNRRDH